MATNVPRLVETLLNSVDTDYSNGKFRLVLEDHLPLIVRSDKTHYLDVSPDEAQHYVNNFYGLLTAMRIEYKYHWIIMRCNGYTNPHDFDGVMGKLLYPDVSMIDSLYGTWRTTYRSL